MQNDRLHIKRKINHIRYFSYKYRENIRKYNLNYFYWQWFKKISDYFDKIMNKTWLDTWGILAPVF